MCVCCAYLCLCCCFVCMCVVLCCAVMCCDVGLCLSVFACVCVCASASVFACACASLSVCVCVCVCLSVRVCLVFEGTGTRFGLRFKGTTRKTMCGDSHQQPAVGLTSFARPPTVRDCPDGSIINMDQANWECLLWPQKGNSQWTPWMVRGSQTWPPRLYVCSVTIMISNTTGLWVKL